jgi:hypothetical protein
MEYKAFSGGGGEEAEDEKKKKKEGKKGRICSKSQKIQ